MLAACGLSSLEDLYRHVPQDALIREPLEDEGILARDGVTSRAGEQQITVHLSETISADALRDRIRGFTGIGDQSGKDLQNVNVSSVIEAGGDKGRIWSVTTTVTNKRLVQHAIAEALGDQLVTGPTHTNVNDFRAILVAP